MPLWPSLSDGVTLSRNEEEEGAWLLVPFFSISSSTWCSMISLSSFSPIVEELRGGRGRSGDHAVDGGVCKQPSDRTADRKEVAARLFSCPHRRSFMKESEHSVVKNRYGALQHGKWRHRKTKGREVK